MVSRIYTAILMLGVYSQIVQAMLIRESLVVFYGNEISMGGFFASWLFWLAAGSLLVVQQRDKEWVRQPLPWLRLFLWLLPVVLVLQIILFRLVRLVLDVSSSEFVPLDQLFLSLFLITAPGSLLMGVSFPLACKALQESQSRESKTDGVGVISGLYVADALGALLGGVLFTFILIKWFGITASLGLTLVALSFTALTLTPEKKRLRWVSILFISFGFMLVLTPVNRYLDRYLESVRFATLQPGLQLSEALETKYGHVALAKLEDQTSIVNNGQITQSFPLPLAIRQEAAYVLSQAAGAQRILLFGGFASGLAAEMLQYPVKSIAVVEEDQRAFERVRSYLPEESLSAISDPKVQIHFMDGRQFLHALEPDEHFDLVLVLNASPASATSNRFFTIDFYQQIAQHLTQNGVICTRVSGASNYLGQIVQSFTGSVFHSLKQVFPNVAIAPGDEYTFCASPVTGRVTEDAAELENRYLTLSLKEERYNPKLLHTLLQPEPIAYARSQLEQASLELNSDNQPITYYLNMLLWGQFTASDFALWMEQLRLMGYWIYLVPILLFIGLWLLRTSLEGFQRSQMLRKVANLSLFILGMIAMAAQLMVLFSYQSHVGFIFERVALLNGIFMTGLALGAGLGQLLGRGTYTVIKLIMVLILVALLLTFLPTLLTWLGQINTVSKQWGYLGLSALVGALTGCGFPLGVRLTEQEQPAVVRSGGLTEAADNLGGALGGLITGALMVPILGITVTSYLLSVITLMAVLPLIYASSVPERIQWLFKRGYRAFPISGIGWIFTGIVLLALAWAQAQQYLQTAPQVHFSDLILADVSGSNSFELIEEPFAYYLGRSDDSQVETISLASMAAAPEVRGFGGEINLLVALDSQGSLRGIRYIDSHETASYISEIQQWLNGFIGKNIATQGLSLDTFDAMSGATVSSKAAIRAINLSARAAGLQGFDKSFANDINGEGENFWKMLPLVATLVLLAAFFPVYRSGSEWGRLLFQFTSLLILGIWLNSQVTEVDLVNLGLGNYASFAELPQHWLLIGFSLITALLLGPVWCGYLCPFGALQEFISRLGHHLGLRSYPSRPLDRWLRMLKYLILGLLLMVVWFSGNASWALFDPMQYVFGEHWPTWMMGIIVAVLLGALFYYRIWCRYLCPVGALLAMGNKFALLQKWAPQRRLKHCDLGVKDDFDIDCIRCNRCLTGKDTHLKTHRMKSKHPRGAERT